MKEQKRSILPRFFSRDTKPGLRPLAVLTAVTAVIVAVLLATGGPSAP